MYQPRDRALSAPEIPNSPHSVESAEYLAPREKAVFQRMLDGLVKECGPVPAPRVLLNRSLAAAHYDPRGDFIELPVFRNGWDLVTSVVPCVMERTQHAYARHGAVLSAERSDQWVFHHPLMYLWYTPIPLDPTNSSKAIDLAVRLRTEANEVPALAVRPGLEDSLSKLFQLLQVDIAVLADNARKAGSDLSVALGEQRALPQGHLWFAAPKLAELSWIREAAARRGFPKTTPDPYTALNLIRNVLPELSPLRTWFSQIAFRCEKVWRELD